MNPNIFQKQIFILKAIINNPHKKKYTEIIHDLKIASRKHKIKINAIKLIKKDSTNSFNASTPSSAPYSKPLIEITSSSECSSSSE